MKKKLLIQYGKTQDSIGNVLKMPGRIGKKSFQKGKNLAKKASRMNSKIINNIFK